MLQVDGHTDIGGYSYDYSLGPCARSALSCAALSCACARSALSCRHIGAPDLCCPQLSALSCLPCVVHTCPDVCNTPCSLYPCAWHAHIRLPSHSYGSWTYLSTWCFRQWSCSSRLSCSVCSLVHTPTDTAGVAVLCRAQRRPRAHHLPLHATTFSPSLPPTPLALSSALSSPALSSVLALCLVHPTSRYL